jgi:hypothetical protein
MTTAQTVRKGTQRKQIAKEIKALQKMEAAIVKLRMVICDNSLDIKTVDTFNQISDIYARLDVAVTVIDSAVQGKANDLARTFTTK